MNSMKMKLENNRGAPRSNNFGDNAIRQQQSSATIVDRLARLKGWLGARRNVHADPRGKRFANLVATVISKTYAERGDAATLADNTALMIIRDILLELDEGIIKKNEKNKFLRSFMGNTVMYRITDIDDEASEADSYETK